jgi:hypothetical protein
VEASYYIHTYYILLHTSGAHKNNSSNTTKPIFVGLNKTTEKTRAPQREGGAVKDK